MQSNKIIFLVMMLFQINNLSAAQEKLLKSFVENQVDGNDTMSDSGESLQSVSSDDSIVKPKLMPSILHNQIADWQESDIQDAASVLLSLGIKKSIESDDVPALKRVRFDLSDNKYNHAQQDVIVLNNLIESAGSFDSCLIQHDEQDSFTEIDQAIQNNLVIRQKEFQKKIYTACLFRALEKYQISLEDFNKIESLIRQALLSSIAKSDSQEIYFSLYSQGIVSAVVQQCNGPLSLQQKNKKIQVKKFDNHLYSQAIEKVLRVNYLSVEDFNELSPFRKITLLLKLNVQDYENLPICEQNLINSLRIERNKYNNYCYKKSKQFKTVSEDKIDIIQTDLSENQQAGIQVEV